MAYYAISTHTMLLLLLTYLCIFKSIFNTNYHKNVSQPTTFKESNTHFNTPPPSITCTPIVPVIQQNRLFNKIKNTINQSNNTMGDVMEDKEDIKTEYVFNYGSNMLPKHLKNCKDINPYSIQRGYISVWRLSFSYAILSNKSDPCFANIVPYNKDNNDHKENDNYPFVHGCIIEINPLGFDKLDGYEFTYVRKQFEAFVYEEDGGGTCNVWTYVMTKEHEIYLSKKYGSQKYKFAERLPSKNYLNTIIEGAKAIDLNKNYIKYLKSQRFQNYLILKPCDIALAYYTISGAMSVGTILMNQSDDIAEMYSGAIMQSNRFGLPLRTSNSWESVSDKYIKSAQCNDDKNIGECLRTEKTSQELLDAQLDVSNSLFANCKTFKCYWIHLFLFWTPTFKTNILPQLQPLISFENGEYNKNIPIIIGTNKDEGITFVYQLINQIHGDYTKGLCKTEYKALIYTIMGFDLGNQIINEYKNLEPNCFRADYRSLLSKIIGDFWFVCSLLNVVNSISKNSKSMVYKYNYNYLCNKWDDTYFLDNIYCEGKNDNICHGVELLIVFHDKTLKINFNDDENALSEITQMYWTNLALLGKPGPGKNINTHKTYSNETIYVYIPHSDENITIITTSSKTDDTILTLKMYITI